MIWHSPTILAVQAALDAKGQHLTLDGLAGPKTWRAIEGDMGLGIADITAGDIPQVIYAVQRQLNVEGLYDGPQDGDAGPLTWEALAKYLKTGKAQQPPLLVPIPAAKTPGTVDARSAAAILTLHPQVQPLAEQLIVHADAALSAAGTIGVITSATRTFAEQSALYAQGRTTSGQRVTNAPAGFSNHNFGLAFDITLFRNGQPIWEDPRYSQTVAPLGKALGFTWGGDWIGIVDEPHYELRPVWAAGMSEADMLSGLRARVAAGADVFADFI